MAVYNLFSTYGQHKSYFLIQQEGRTRQFFIVFIPLTLSLLTLSNGHVLSEFVSFHFQFLGYQDENVQPISWNLKAWQDSMNVMADWFHGGDKALQKLLPAACPNV